MVFLFQHAMILPVLFEHLRFHECLSELEKNIDYQFKDRSLLQVRIVNFFLLYLCNTKCFVVLMDLSISRGNFSSFNAEIYFDLPLSPV